MPWDQPQQPPEPAPRYQPPAQPPYVPPPGRPYDQQGAQRMQPDLPPIVARNPQTGEQVRVDIGAELREAIRQAVTGAVAQNKDTMIASGQKLATNALTGQKSTVNAAVPAALADSELEDNFQMGPATKRTLLNGLAVDLGFAAMAVIGTVSATDFDITDTEAWTLVGVMLVKTVIQTGMSYVMRLKVT
jgi:hypothetical protein